MVIKLVYIQAAPGALAATAILDLQLEINEQLNSAGRFFYAIWCLLIKLRGRSNANGQWDNFPPEEIRRQLVPEENRIYRKRTTEKLLA